MKVPDSVAIVGGGFSGAVLVVQLLRAGFRGSILLFERDKSLARGIAYGTRCDRHLLNVPAAGMSAFPDDAEHFLRWLQRKLPGATNTTFAPRRLYGDYLEELLKEALEKAGRQVRVCNEEVTSCIRSGSLWTIATTAGGTHQAEVVILATGHVRPQAPVEVPASLEAKRKFVSNPWQPGVLEGLAPHKPILLIGSGLTAADMVLECREVGFSGDVYILSRRGFLPRVHELAFKPSPKPAVSASQGSARALLRALREVIDAGHENWRSSIDSLRPETQALWRGLGATEQRRFLRHIRPYWEVHRHRVAPEVARELEDLVKQGKLRRLSGRVHSVTADGENIRVSYAQRADCHLKEVLVQRVINCTGPGASLAMCETALTKQLLRDGYCRLDELGIGLDVDDLGRTISKRGVPEAALLTIGSLRKGVLWETTAVRELREQAKKLAELIATIGIQADDVCERHCR